MTRVLDDRHLHAETDPEIGDPVLPRELHSADLALDSPVTETSRHDDAVHVDRRQHVSHGVDRGLVAGAEREQAGMFAEYLEEGLSMMGLSCEEYEMNRL